MLLSVRLRIGFILLSLTLVGCDHATKHWAKAALGAGGAIELMPGVLDLRYAENPGMAFSLMREMPHAIRFPLLVAVGVVVTTLVVASWLHRRRTSAEHAAFALVVAGALGNLVDRVARGHVVDFIHLHHWPIFNVADVCVGAGAVLLFAMALTSDGAGPLGPGASEGADSSTPPAQGNELEGQRPP